MLLSEAIERYMRSMIERRDATETTDITYRSILRKLQRYMCVLRELMYRDQEIERQTF